MANTIGEAIIKLKFDGNSVKSELKNISSEAEKSSGKWSNAFKTAAKVSVAAFSTATTAAIGFITKATKTAIEGFAEYEQLVGGVDTLFKDSSEKVQKYADIAYKTAQISANQYMSTITTFSASLLQSLGGDTEKAADIANQAVIDMADNANKMGTSMEAVQNVYSSLARGIYTTLDNLKLGYGGTRGEMQRLLQDAEKISGIHFEMGNYADMVQAIHVIQQEMGITGTSALEASKTIQGSVRATKAAWQNLIVGMADDNQNFETLMDNFVSSASTALENLIPRIEIALQGVATLMEKLAPMLIEKLPALIQTLIPPFLNVVTQVAIALIQAAPQILTMILNAFLAALPDIITAIVVALPQIIEAIIGFLTNPETIGALIDAAIQLFMALVLAVPQILGGLISAFGRLVGNLWEAIKQMFSQFAANFGKFITDIFKGAINGMLTFIENFINAPINLLNGFLDIINGAFGWLGVHINHIDTIKLPRLAEGGIVNSETTAVIGENGQEAVLPLENNTDNWAGLLAGILVDKMDEQTGGGTINVYMNNNINNKLDAEEIGSIMMRSIRRAA